MLLRLSQEIIDMICDMLFTFDRKHVVDLAATCKALRRRVPRQTPAYFPLSLKQRTFFPKMFVLQDTQKEHFRKCVTPAFYRTHFTAFMRLSEVIEVAKRLQYQAPTEVEKLSWILPTCEITKLLTKVISHAYKTEECRPFSCFQDTRVLYDYDQAAFRQNVLDAANLAACYLTLVCPYKVSINELLLACLHLVRNSNTYLLRMLHCDSHLKEEVRTTLVRAAQQTHERPRDLLSRCCSLVRGLLWL